jgi:PAS domain S-box-containing protein
MKSDIATDLGEGTTRPPADPAGAKSVCASWSEAQRLAALARYGILDTPAEAEFDDIARLAADVFEAPIAVVNLVAEGRQWFKAEVGLGVRETPLDVSICAHAILQPGIFVVPDTTQDERFSCNPLVTGAPGLRFYAGALLETPEGLPLGTLCVLDTVARPGGITERQRLTLEVLARQVMTQLELRRAVAGRDAELERAQAIEAALRAERDRSEGVLQHMAECFALLDPDFRIVAMNAEGLRLDGRPREEIVGKTHSEAYPDSLELGELYEKAMAERMPVRREHCYAFEGGREAWLEMRAYPLPDGSLAVFYRDVSERHEAEKRLRESEARLRVVQEAGGIGSFDYDLQKDEAICSPEYYAMFGLPQGQPINRESWPQAIHPEDRQKAVEVLERAIAERKPFNYEYRIVRADTGETRCLSGRAAIVFDAEGRPWRYVGGNIDITDRKAAEEALRIRGEEFYSLADNIPTLCWMAYPDGHIFWYNRRWYEYTGTSPDSQEGWGWESVHDPDLLPEVVERWKRSLATGEPFEMIFPLKGADGNFRPFLTRIVPIRNEAGEISRWFGTNTDVAEQRAAEEALAAARSRAEAEATQRAAILSQLAEGVIVTDGGGNITFVNQAAERLHGVARLDVAPEEYSETYHLFTEDGRPYPPLDLPLARAVRGETVEEARWRIRRPDGSEVLAIGSARPIRGGEGGQIGAVLTLRDHTAREAAERQLRESEARIRALTDNLPSGMVYQLTSGVDGTERRFLYVSQSHEKLTGIPAEAVLADPGVAYSLIHPEDQALLVEAEAASIRDARPFDVQVRFRRADGELRWCRIISAPRAQPDGSLIWDGIQIDVTDQKRAEELLQSLNSTLEQRVAERTSELEAAQEQLRQSQKLEAMGQLTGGVAHDFNNLLTPIVGSLDLLHRRGLGGEREQRLIDGALQSAERAKTLVQRLLAFARRQPLQPSAVDIGNLVAGMADLVASTSGPQVKVVVDVPEELPAATADQNQLEMAILNLSVNARDAMPDGGTLTVSAACETVAAGHRAKLKPGDYVRLSVADTGTGMDEATLARAIEPFFSTKGIGKGTGLGLSMVHGLASQLGGSLAIASRPGLGTRIELWLPVSAQAAEAAEQSGTAALEAKAIGTALLVDDEELVRATTADMLADLGYEVVEAASAEEALKALNGGLRIDLLVTDHLMPGMTGVDLARRVREQRPGTPVLIVSGYTEAEAIAPDLPRLTKPFRQTDVAASLAEVMARQA